MVLILTQILSCPLDVGLQIGEKVKFGSLEDVINQRHIFLRTYKLLFRSGHLKQTTLSVYPYFANRIFIPSPSIQIWSLILFEKGT